MAFGNFEFPNANVYDSDLREVLRRIKDLVDRYNSLVEDVENANAKADDAIARVKVLEQEWSNIEKTIRAILADAMAEYEKEFNHKLEELLIKINQLDTDLQNIYEYIDIKNERVILIVSRMLSDAVADLQSQIDWLIEQLDGTNEMYSPLRGRVQKIPDCVKDLWESERYLGLTNAQMAHYDKTNAQWAALNLSNYEFAINLKGWVEDWGVRSVYHAALGTKTYPQNVDSYNLTMIMGTMTNEEYADLDLTNAEYEALNLTNMDYLSYGAGEIIHHSDIVGFVNTNGSGLTNEQLSSLGIEV